MELRRQFVFRALPKSRVFRTHSLPILFQLGPVAVLEETAVIGGMAFTESRGPPESQSPNCPRAQQVAGLSGTHFRGLPAVLVRLGCPGATRPVTRGGWCRPPSQQTAAKRPRRFPEPQPACVSCPPPLCCTSGRNPCKQEKVYIFSQEPNVNAQPKPPCARHNLKKILCRLLPARPRTRSGSSKTSKPISTASQVTSAGTMFIRSSSDGPSLLRTRSWCGGWQRFDSPS